MTPKPSRLLIGPCTDFNPNQDIPLFLWSFVDSQSQLTPCRAYFPDLRLSHQDQFEINSQLDLLIDHHLLPWMADHLNQLHSVAYSTAYWALLLKPWMGHLVSSAFYHFWVIQTVLAQNPNTQFTTETLSLDAPWVIKDTFDFIYRYTTSVPFHHAMVSTLIRHCFTQQIHTTDTSYTPTPANFDNGPDSTGHRSARRFYFVRGVSDFKEQLFSLFLTLKPPTHYPLPDPIFLPKPNELPFDPSFIDALHTLLRDTLPYSFTQNYGHFETLARKKRYKKGKIRVVGPAPVILEQIKFYLAHAREHGEIIITNQHGGNYGWHLAHREPMLLEYRFHYFISWGWQTAGHIGSNIVPLPAPYLRPFKNRHHETAQELIIVGTDINPFSASSIPSHFNGLKTLEYRDAKLNLISQLSPDIFAATYYREYQSKDGRLEDLNYLRRTIPSLNALEGDLHYRLLHCRLCCLDHLGTTFLICLAANVPFICVWSPDHCDLNEEATVLLNQMKDEGLYFDTPAAAAAHINGIWHSIDAWWKDKQPIRRRLVDQHANTDPWIVRWASFLMAL